MKIRSIISLSHIQTLTVLVFLISSILFSSNLYAQKDSTRNNLQNLSLLGKDSEDVVVYDAESNSYLYFKKGKEKERPYKVLSKAEYDAAAMDEAQKKNWQRKRDENAAQNASSKPKGFVPQIKTTVNNDVFGTVFGGNDVQLDFSGSVEVLFGIKSTKIDNPLIPPQYRRTTTPTFDTKYDINLSGKIGTRIKANFTFSPNSTFDFETNLKLGYTGSEDDIIQLVEIGNVSMPLNNSLISGSQSLFGGKVGLRFGKLDVMLLASQQKGESKTIVVKGGSQSKFFDLRADEYEANRHFFISHYYRDQYERALANLPLVNSSATVTKIEVWVTNKVNRTEDVRNVVAFMDLAEPKVIFNQVPQFSANGQTLPDNDANKQYKALVALNLRNFANINPTLQQFVNLPKPFVAGQDYEKLERARRLNPTEYSFNTELGYISLNTALNNDEVLAVAYEYTSMGRIHNVGELTSQGTTAADSTLILKMLKGTQFSPKLPTWKLMMKNIYTLNAYNINPNKFELSIFYEDSQSGTAIPYITEGPIANQALLSVMGLDRLNIQGDPYPDGVFDFVSGVTVVPQRSRIIFPVLEPFGSHLKRKFKGDAVADKYLYQELYDSTLVKAQELSEKNKFHLQGSYESSAQGEIQLEASNVPEGSVVVMAGGVKLMEGIDYQVNYMAGTVSIINASYLESAMPITITLENRQNFSMQTKTLVGADLNYAFNKKFRVGGTIMHLNEKPMTQKVSYNEDPVSNTIWGMNTSYATESQMISNWVSKIPLLNSKGLSSFNFDAEFANLIAGQPGGIQGKMFIDDFEGAKASIDLKNYLAWTLASTPQGQKLFPEASLYNDVGFNKNRAKLAWYWTDPELLRNSSSTPAYMRQNPGKYQENHFVREIPFKEIYPNREVLIGTPDYLSTLNLNYYPRERGSYNYDAVNLDRKGFLNNPELRWGGIMRSLPITDFETANYDYIEFWVMDPFTYNKDKNAKGDFYINLGTVSEDVLRDGYKSYEQGIPFPFDTSRVIKTAWGYVPKAPALVNTFDGDTETRRGKDVGLDGLSSQMEAAFFSNFIQAVQTIVTDPAARQKLLFDPSSDDFVYYRAAVYDERQATIMERYKDFNNTEGNSSQASGAGQNSEVYTLNPDMEDINRDNTMEENESYYQYKISMRPNMQVGENHIENIIQLDSFRFASQGIQPTRWYQFKIPISEYEQVVGPISDFKSIRFMRMFLHGFADTTVMRFASLELVRSDWRKFGYSLIKGQEGLTQPELPNTSFEVSVVNIEENSQRTPVNYIMPPGTDRVIDPSAMQERQLNEQAMQLSVKGLPDGDARAVYKNITYDLRQYRRMQMDVHAEAITGDVGLRDNELSVFVRMGSDLKNNYYEYEIPLKLTNPGHYGDHQKNLVWPEGNFLDIDLNELTDIKLFRNANNREQGGSIHTLYEKPYGDHTIRVMGNPNLGEVRSMMIGVRNPIIKEDVGELGMPKSATIWVNELRMTDFENKGGWAAVARTGVRLADFGTISLSGGLTTAGFGGLEQRQSERSQEDVYRYDFMSNFEMGKFFNPKLGLSIPVFFSYAERFANPLYDPLSKDVKYKDAMKSLNKGHERDSLRNLAQDYVRRKSFNITNMRMNPEGSKGGILSISNLSLSFAYNETFAHNLNLERHLQKEYRAALVYGYSISPLYIEPFKKFKFLQSPWLALIKDFNFNLVPNQFTFSTDVYRMYDERQNRNIAYPQMQLPGTFAKDFTWNRNYNLSWDLAKSLRFTYAASNQARIDEPVGMVDRKRDPNGYKHWKDSIWSNVWKLGRTVAFNQNFGFAYTAPLSKLKLTDWINATGTYDARFNWQAAPIMVENDYGEIYDPGNIIGNGRTMGAMSTFNFLSLYNKSSWLKGVNDEFSGKKRPGKTTDVKFDSKKMAFKPKTRRTVKHNLGTSDVRVRVTDGTGKVVKARTEVAGKNSVYVTTDTDVKDATVSVTGKMPEKRSPSEMTLRVMARMAMMVRTANINYTQDESSVLPGFKGKTKFFGLDNFNSRLAPGLDFVMGSQATDFVQRARQYGWMTTDTSMTSAFVMRKTTNLTLNFKLEPVRDLQIDLTGMRRRTHDRTIYDIVVGTDVEQITGGFEISTITIATAFENPSASNKYRSKAFENFNQHRKQIAWRQARERQAQTNGAYNPGGDVYPDGYNGSSQDVLLPAFLAAYTGKSAGGVTLDNFWSIPLPNWRITYAGFSKTDWFKKYFTAGKITHSYTSVYSLNAYTNNLDFSREEDGFSWTKNQLGNFVTELNALNVSIRESFRPLIGVDLSWKNDLSTKFSVDKNRAVGLSLANNQVTELKNTTYSIELGYFFRKVPLIIKFGEDRQKRLDTDLKLNARLSLLDDRSFLRSLDETEQETQIASGNRGTRFNLSADYTLYKGVNLRMYYDYDFTRPYISAITVSNTNFGFSLRFSFSQ